MTNKSTVPSYKDLLWPTLRAVREIGDSGTIEEIVEKVIELEGFSEDQQAVPHGDGPTSEIEYRLAWAHLYRGHGSPRQQQAWRLEHHRGGEVPQAATGRSPVLRACL
jgi:restriction endonuclease Mrr